MRITFFIAAAPSYFCNWLEDFTRHAYDVTFPTEKGRISLQRATPSGVGNFVHMTMGGFYMVEKDTETAWAYPLGRVIDFKIISLAPDRIEIQASCHQPVAQQYFVDLLGEINKRWPQSDDINAQLLNLKATLEAGVAEIKKGQAEISSLVRENEKYLSQIREAVQQGRIEQGEIARYMDAIRRVVQYIIARGDSEFSPEVLDRAAKAEATLNGGLSLQQKLELTIPILPMFLNYKVELGAGTTIHAEAQKTWDALIRL